MMQQRLFLTVFVLVLSMLSLYSCGESDPSPAGNTEAEELMQRAVETSMHAGRYYQLGQLDSANQLNYDALNMFMQVLDLDSNNAKAMSAVGFSYIMAEDYEMATPWFTRALAIDSTMVEARRQLGIALIAEGQVPQGKRQIRRSLEMMDVAAARKLTLRSLDKIGTEAYQIGAIYGIEGDTLKMRELTYYSIGILAFAHEIGGPDTAVALKIADYARSVGDEETAKQFTDAYSDTAAEQ